MKTKPIIYLYDDAVINNYKSKTKVEIYIPKTGITIPKESDYNKGYYYRFFYRLVNNKNAIVYEIQEKEYNKLQKEKIYKVLKIKWKLIGPRDVAKEINTKIIEISNQVLTGIKLTLIDPLQFWRNLPDTIPQFDVTNKLPRTEIKKKHYNVDIVSVVAFDERGLVYILTEFWDIIYTEDGVGILFQG